MPSAGKQGLFMRNMMPEISWQGVVGSWQEWSYYWFKGKYQNVSWQGVVGSWQEWSYYWFKWELSKCKLAGLSWQLAGVLYVPSNWWPTSN